MGIVKGKGLEDQERGFSLNEGKVVCINCFEERGLKQFIEEHQSHQKCSYCKNDLDLATCDLDSLIEHILTSIQCEWGHPADEGLPYDTREGGWQASEVYDVWDLLDTIGLENVHGEVYEDICSSIENNEWCKKDPYSLSKDRTLLYAWLNFSEFVTNKARYVFWRAENPSYDKDQHDEMNPINILDSLHSIIKETDLTKEISRNTDIYRIRITSNVETLTTVTDLGSPPLEFATMANRMSPAGVPMFYGAFDVDTAIKETYDPCNEVKKAAIGIFNPIRPLNVIDLSEGLYIPSLFAEHERDRRDYMRFLLDFVADFTKPIERNNRAHVDYVPTQVVTEYIRHIVRDGKNNRIDGVIYPSSKNLGNKAIVIFATSDQCVEKEETKKDGALLVMRQADQTIISSNALYKGEDLLVHKTQIKDEHCLWPFQYSFDLNCVNCPRCLELIESGNNLRI